MVVKTTMGKVEMRVAGCGEARRGVTAWAAGVIRSRGCEMALGPKEGGLQIMEIYSMEIRMETQI